MKSGNTSTSTPKPSPTTKPDTYPASEMLTSSELEQLRREAKDATAYYRKNWRSASLRGRQMGLAPHEMNPGAMGACAGRTPGAHSQGHRTGRKPGRCGA
jgi:hypothetical protein